MIAINGILALIFLFSTGALTALTSAIQRIGRLQVEEEFKKIKALFFFHKLLPFFFGRQRWDGILFSLSFTKQILRIGFVLSIFFYLLNLPFFQHSLTEAEHAGYVVNSLSVLLMTMIIIATSLIVDFLFNLLGKWKPHFSFQLFAFLSSLILLLCIPITAPFFHLLKIFYLKFSEKKGATPFRIRDKVSELLKETELGAHLDPNEQKLILSVVSFKERIAREVMVPRINLFSLPSDTTVREASEHFIKEGYSRIPVYHDSVDNIVGVLLYKDILRIFIESEKTLPKLEQPIEKLIKPILYAPETKKISHLLQEFRSKQIHLAIIVDEWGGTEGIVTIEDILEELVGEIADEYDVGPQDLYRLLPSGGWIVDAKMSIIDIEEELGVRIPTSPEYDTIGGYIFHKAGAIPTKGWRIHHDDFDLEVISSSERSIEKIKIIPHIAT